MGDNIRKAYSEVSKILELLGAEYVNKIPNEIIENINKEKDNEYIVNINPDIPLEEQNLLQDTISILAMLKLDYWCENEDEKKELLNILNKNEEEYQKEMREKYNPDDLFKNKRKREPETDIKEETSISIIDNKSFIAKLLEKIRSMFKFNKE